MEFIRPTYSYVCTRTFMTLWYCPLVMTGIDIALGFLSLDGDVGCSCSCGSCSPGGAAAEFDDGIDDGQSITWTDVAGTEGSAVLLLMVVVVLLPVVTIVVDMMPCGRGEGRAAAAPLTGIRRGLVAAAVEAVAGSRRPPLLLPPPSCSESSSSSAIKNVLAPSSSPSSAAAAAPPSAGPPFLSFPHSGWTVKWDDDVDGPFMMVVQGPHVPYMRLRNALLPSINQSKWNGRGCQFLLLLLLSDTVGIVIDDYGWLAFGRQSIRLVGVRILKQGWHRDSWGRALGACNGSANGSFQNPVERVCSARAARALTETARASQASGRLERSKDHDAPCLIRSIFRALESPRFETPKR